MRIRLLAIFFTVIFLPLSCRTRPNYRQPRFHSCAYARRDRSQRSSRRGDGGRDARLCASDDAQGWADPEHKSFMRVDSIFWIASMSKRLLLQRC